MKHSIKLQGNKIALFLYLGWFGLSVITGGLILLSMLLYPLIDEKVFEVLYDLLRMFSAACFVIAALTLLFLTPE